MKIFFCRKLEGRCGGGKFSGITGGRSYTVPTAFGQGGIETLRLSFAAGSPGNWGFHGPPNWVKLWTLQMPQKIQGVVGESFPLEGILSPRVRHGWPHPHFPPKNFWGGSKFQILAPYSPKTGRQIFVKLSLELGVGGLPQLGKSNQNVSASFREMGRQIFEVAHNWCVRRPRKNVLLYLSFALSACNFARA